MEINSVSDFEVVLMDDFKTLFGNCKRYKGVIRSLPEHLGVSNTSAIVEASFEPGLNPEILYPVLHFHVTLAQKIEESLVPGILSGLNDLNTAISAGAFPSFGCFGYYAPLGQIYLSYRMPLNDEHFDIELKNVRYYLSSLCEVLDLFADYILFLCDDPQHLTLEDYMRYLDAVSDLNDLEYRLNELEKVLNRIPDESPEGNETGEEE